MNLSRADVTRDAAGRALRIVEEIMTHVRDLMGELHPQGLEEYGLHAPLKN
jgi:signal transduction histidine kinase